MRKHAVITINLSIAMNAPNPSTPSFAGAPRFADVTHDQVVAQARALVPALRSRAAQAETARVMLPEPVADLHRIGALRILRPKRWGGMALDFIA